MFGLYTNWDRRGGLKIELKQRKGEKLIQGTEFYWLYVTV